MAKMIWLVTGDEVVGGLVFFALPPRDELDLLVHPATILDPEQVAILADDLRHGHRNGTIGPYDWTDDPTGLGHQNGSAA